MLFDKMSHIVTKMKTQAEKGQEMFTVRENRNTNLDTGGRSIKLLLGDDDRPSFSSFPEHLLGLKELALFKNHIPNCLSGSRGSVENLFDTIDEGDGDLGRAVVGSALDDQLASGVGFLGLASITLRQEFHARS